MWVFIIPWMFWIQLIISIFVSFGQTNLTKTLLDKSNITCWTHSWAATLKGNRINRKSAFENLLKELAGGCIFFHHFHLISGRISVLGFIKNKPERKENPTRGSLCCTEYLLHLFLSTAWRKRTVPWPSEMAHRGITSGLLPLPH